MAQQQVDRATLDAYWSENKRLTFITLVIWFIVSYGAAFFSKELNSITIFGFPLGFYMGSQGSLIVFVLLIFNYARVMNATDIKYNLQEEE